MVIIYFISCYLLYQQRSEGIDSFNLKWTTLHPAVQGNVSSGHKLYSWQAATKNWWHCRLLILLNFTALLWILLYVVTSI